MFLKVRRELRETDKDFPNSCAKPLTFHLAFRQLELFQERQLRVWYFQAVAEEYPGVADGFILFFVYTSLLGSGCARCGNACLIAQGMKPSKCRGQ